MKLKIGDEAPAFSLPDQEDKKHSLSHHKGRWVFLYFYPKDDTPGCTKEACGIRDVYGNLTKAGLRVFGVSVDSVESHKKFAEKYHLPFTLLSDADKETVKAYNVWGKKKFLGREYLSTLRTSFLINPEGRIAKIYENVKPENHAKEILDDFKALKRNG